MLKGIEIIKDRLQRKRHNKYEQHKNINFFQLLR